MSNEDKILSTMRQKGPVLPADIARAIESNILFASAHLSELVGRGKVKISNTKIGGSPVYYLEGQEPKLQDLSKHLNNKEQRVYDLIKNKKVLKDSDVSPSTRVMIRNIKDFAIPIQVDIKGQKVLFWKWYLLKDDELQKELNKLINPEQEKKQEEQKKLEENKDMKIEEGKDIDEEKKKLYQEKENLQKELEIEKQKLKKELEAEKEKIRKELEEKNKIEQEKKKLEQERKKLEQEKLNLKKQTEEKQEIIREPVQEETKQEPDLTTETDPFSSRLKSYFEESKIKMLENNIVKKGKDIEMLLNIPSVVGQIEYFCKAKDKKKINDGDLSSAFLQGHLKRLPVLFLTTGELTKKAKEMIEKELKGIVVKQI